MDGSSRSDDAYAAERLGLVTALLDGDAGLAFQQVRDLMGAGVAFDEILFELLVPIQADVGRRWAVGDYGVGEEHAVSAAVETVVSLLAGSFDQPVDGDHIVVASAEGETHALAARVIAAFLTYRDFRVTNLGATLPTADLQEFLEIHRPGALVLTCSMPANLRGARRSIAAAHAAGVPVVAGGIAFGASDARARALGTDAWLANPRLLVGLLQRWTPDIAESEAAAVDPGAPGVADKWMAIAAVAEAVAAETGVVGSGRAAVRIDVELFVSTLDGALLVDDSGPVVDLAKWHASHVAASNRAATTRAILAGIGTRLGAVDGRVEHYVTAAAVALD